MAINLDGMEKAGYEILRPTFKLYVDVLPIYPVRFNLGILLSSVSVNSDFFKSSKFEDSSQSRYSLG